MTFNPRALSFRLLIYLAFFASGAACLVAEVTWNRMLIVVVGNSLGATAMIVAIFMGGLGAGSYVGGRVISKRKPSLLPYALLEAAVGLYVLASPALFDALSGLFTSLADAGGDRGYLTFARIAVTSAALAVPAFLMGATFPAIVSATAHHSRSGSARTGYLYSVNTLGAAIGCFVAGYHLLFELGVSTTLKVAFTLYVVAAMSAVVARLLAVEYTGTFATDRDQGRPASAATASVRRFLYVATFAVGFVALAYEVLLTRMGILYLGNSVSVFALVLTGFLLGTGISAVLGTWLYGVLQRTTAHADRLFGALAVAAGVLVVATPYLLLEGWFTSPDAQARRADTAPHDPLMVLAIIIAPTVLLGGLLPIAIRMLQPDGRRQTTRGAANLYALNTAGALLGAGLANHYLVPLVGVQGVLAGLGALCVGIGLYNLLPARRLELRWGGAAAGLVAVLLIVAIALPSVAGLYGRYVAASTHAQTAEVKLVVEGRAATVTVIDQADPALGTYRDMYLNGVEEASTRYWHTQLFKLLGVLPVLIHEASDPKQVLVIAFGAGITAGSTLAAPDVASLDVVDLNPDIEGINDLFVDVNGDVFHEPRFHFYDDDGRNYLVTSGKRYDVIVNDSTHPRAYDSWILYTEEFYRAVEHRLRPGGVFAQWVPVLGSMQGDLFKIHLNTFRRVFPNTTVWYVYGSDQAFLLATPTPLTLDRERLQRQLDRLPDWFGAGEYQIDTVERIAGFFWMDDAALARMIGGETRVNTDDVHYFGKQSAVYPAPPEQRLPAYQTSAMPLFRDSDPAFAHAVQKEQAVAQRLARAAFFGRTDDLLAAACLLPDNGNVLFWMNRRFAGEPPAREVYCDQELQSYRALVAQHPDNVTALNGLAYLLGEAGELEEAEEIAARAMRLAQNDPMILDTYGWILFQRNKIGPAMAALKQAQSLAPEDPVILYHLGAVYGAAGEPAIAQQLAAKALSLSTDFPGVDDARSLITSN